MMVHLELRLWCFYIPHRLIAKIWSKSWARTLSKPFWGQIHSNVTYHLHSFIHLDICSDSIFINILIICRSRKTNTVLALTCLSLSVITVLVILSIICHLSQLCLYLRKTLWRMWHIFPCAEDCGSEWPEKHAGLHTAKSHWIERPGTSGILHSTYYVLGHSKAFSGVLNSKVVWVLECRVNRWLISTKSCASLLNHLEIMHLFAMRHSHCHAPSQPIGMNTKTHLHTYTHT